MENTSTEFKECKCCNHRAVCYVVKTLEVMGHSVMLREATLGGYCPNYQDVVMVHLGLDLYREKQREEEKEKGKESKYYKVETGRMGCKEENKNG